MGRTRTAILAAAAACVEQQGVRRTTMGDVAMMSGVAKATLYNHFRTKDDVLAALVEHEVVRLGQLCAQTEGLEQALAVAALGVSAHGALRAVA
ncbi:MAG: Transcriptional regulator, TetR family, partial [Frankiales bacterium]|nr:Transcriptional regulator, TetR family [Frankiales bacterium]